MPARLLKDRFWEKVQVRGESDCWEWTAATNEHGYGVIRPPGQRTGSNWKAHRVSLMLAGHDVEGHNVLHSCDNPPCVNPAHLRLGSLKENVRDVFDRDRQAAHQRRTLSPEQIAYCWGRVLEGVPQKELCREFGVSPSTLSGYLKPLKAAHASEMKEVA